MYPETQSYWMEPTDRVAVGLRRYSRRDSAATGSTCEDGFHSSLVFTGEEPASYHDNQGRRVLASRPRTPDDDPSWPQACRCGYIFAPDDHRQDWQELLYRRTDTGGIVVLRNHANDTPGGPTPAPPGACWDAWWMPERWRGPDGIALMVRCPNGQDWHVDSEASNCTRKGEPHECWVRHGDPRECQVTVDKNGDTCAAGAGSILAGDYHGFLRNGRLTAG